MPIALQLTFVVKGSDMPLHTTTQLQITMIITAQISTYQFF